MLEAEPLLTLEEAAKVAHATPKSLRKWITRGHNGFRLEAAKVGRIWFTSQGAIVRFGKRQAGQWMESTSVDMADAMHAHALLKSRKPRPRPVD